MNFTQAVASFFKRYFDFKTRSSRSEYWWVVLFYFLFTFVFAFFDVFLGLNGTLIGILYLFILIPMISLTVRRLHDVGRSGWWIFISIIPLIGSIILLIWYCKPGMSEDNKYGSNPLNT